MPLPTRGSNPVYRIQSRVTVNRAELGSQHGSQQEEEEEAAAQEEAPPPPPPPPGPPRRFYQLELQPVSNILSDCPLEKARPGAWLERKVL